MGSGNDMYAVRVTHTPDERNHHYIPCRNRVTCKSTAVRRLGWSRLASEGAPNLQSLPIDCMRLFTEMLRISAMTLNGNEVRTGCYVRRRENISLVYWTSNRQFDKLKHSKYTDLRQYMQINVMVWDDLIIT